MRSEFGLASEYPSEAVSEARDAADAFAGVRADRTDIPFVTIDPPGALDLDQALHLERTPTGFLLHYAIADVGAVVAPDGALARESLARGQTFYLPDGTVPLHPPVLSEGSASLLPGAVRPAALWTIDCDHKAEPQRFSVRRALVRSRARLDYPASRPTPRPAACIPRSPHCRNSAACASRPGWPAARSNCGCPPNR